MYKQAPRAKIENDSLADMLAKKHGGTVSKTANKDKVKSIDKVINRKGGDVSQLKDVVRNTIVKKGDQTGIINDLKKEGYTIKTTKAETDPFGYSGINAKINKNGIWREVQVNSPEMIYAKEPKNLSRKILGDNMFDQLEKTFNGKGGLGHEMYEAGRMVLDKTSNEFINIADKSRLYYSNFR